MQFTSMTMSLLHGVIVFYRHVSATLFAVLSNMPAGIYITSPFCLLSMYAFVCCGRNDHGQFYPACPPRHKAVGLLGSTRDLKKDDLMCTGLREYCYAFMCPIERLSSFVVQCTRSSCQCPYHKQCPHPEPEMKTPGYRETMN